LFTFSQFLFDHRIALNDWLQFGTYFFLLNTILSPSLWIFCFWKNLLSDVDFKIISKDPWLSITFLWSYHLFLGGHALRGNGELEGAMKLYSACLKLIDVPKECSEAMQDVQNFQNQLQGARKGVENRQVWPKKKQLTLSLLYLLALPILNSSGISFESLWKDKYLSHFIVCDSFSPLVLLSSHFAFFSIIFVFFEWIPHWKFLESLFPATSSILKRFGLHENAGSVF
jgi:hypothetical protein